ncbi:hypothetical protein Pfo_000906 [Paulownia fortunei]|nr:hypothetical protein Pfo_000906 [Paulownia fortunei]
MGFELLEIGVKMRKGVIFTIRGCFRSVCNHPFLVGMLCFLIFLYRSSPFIFSLLVSASPILVCTAVLLGILLSFGQPNIPEIEIEEKTTLDAASIKMRLSGDAAVVEKNESYYVERFSEKRRDEAEQSTEQPDFSAGKLGEVRREDCSDDTAPLIEERSREIELNDGEIWEANTDLGDLRCKQKTQWIEERLNDEEVMENHYASTAKVNDELLEFDDEKSEADSFDSERVNVDSLDSPPRSPWKRVEEREDEEEEVEEEEEEEKEDDDLDSGSSRAESSSPDASMADIMPMLDELHPLLDEEDPQPVHMSRGGSGAASEKSPKSSTSSHESDDETENHEDLEVADDDNEDGEDEEEAQGDKEEQTKSAITWTEEDQKNLMDLGSSEIERNQRLENLILRRRARKNISMYPERNLIDLESSDLPFNIAPISTRRQNPFDLPHDSYDNSGLPPIPGSAPSVLLPRRNPFDIPYDSSEEKPDLMGDGFKEEFTTFQSREPFFRRHESFNVGPSLFAPNRKMRPYFVPEGTVSEESSYSPFQRQSSELSDSKVSSVPETESIGSVEDLEDRKLSEEDNQEEVVAITRTKEVTDKGPSGDPELISQQEEVTEEDVHREPELVSNMESVSEHVGHGSQSSEEEDSLELGQVGKRDVEIGELEFQLEDVADHYQQGSVTRPVEVQATGYHSNYEAVEQRYSRDSSSSSLSEVSERVFTETEGEGLSMLEGRRDGVAEAPGISTQTSIESTDLSITGTLVNDIPHREPVYDSSPREVRKNISSSSISSDVHPESDLGFPPVLVKRTVSFSARESEGSSQTIETDVPSIIEMLPESSVAYLVDESRPIDVVNIREHENTNTDFSGVDQRSESEGSSALKSSVEASVEENLMEQHRWGEVPGSSANNNIHTLVKSSEDQNLDQSQDEKYLLMSGRDSLVEVSEPPFEVQLRAEHTIGMEETVQSPNSDADVYHEADEKLISTPSAEGNTSLFYDKAIHEPNLKHLNEVQASTTPVESSEDVQITQKLNMPEVQELDRDISSNVNSPFSPDFISIPSSATETTSSHVDVQTIIEEADEIKEIDEGLLSELDNVGDFSIKQWGSGSTEFEKHIDSVGEGFSSAHHVETSTIRVIEINSIEENKLEDTLHSEKSRQDIDIYEGDMEYISELQASKTSRGEHIDVSRMEFNERDGQDSPDRETSEDETLSKENEVQPAHSVVNHHYEFNISGISEDRSTEDVDSVPKKSESTSVETEFMVGDAEVSYQGQVDTDTTSGMPELEASTIEDIDLAFKKISAKEIEKPVVLKPPQDELIVGESITEHSEDGAPHRNSSVTDSTHVTSVLEVRPIEDATLDYKQLNDGSTGSHRLPDSVDRTLDVVESGETQGPSSELHVAEPIPSEGTTLPPKQLLDCKTLNTDDGAVEVKADDVASVEESSVQEISAFAAEKPEHEVEAPKDLHSTTSVKGKGEISKSSSSSSSSSESSSSDSDRE